MSKIPKAAATALMLAVAMFAALISPASQAYAAPAPISLYDSRCAIVKQGQTSGCVTELQNLLINAGYGYKVGTADGIFGNQTAQALRDFQRIHLLAQDAVAGPLTRAAFNQALAPLGHLDFAMGGRGSVLVQGWAWDGDKLAAPVTIHVYIGGPAGVGQGYNIGTTRVLRQDVLDYFDLHYYDGHRGFDNKVQTNKTGWQPVYVYAIDNNGKADNPLIGSSWVYIIG